MKHVGVFLHGMFARDIRSEPDCVNSAFSGKSRYYCISRYGLVCPTKLSATTIFFVGYAVAQVDLGH